MEKETELNRQECNIKILEFIKQAIYTYSDLRFFQLLGNIGIIEYDPLTNVVKDKFYEESSETMKKVVKTCVGIPYVEK